MEKKRTRTAEELLAEMESLEVTELDEQALQGVGSGIALGTTVGGTLGGEVEASRHRNTNCGCNGRTFQGDPEASNGNCGC